MRLHAIHKHLGFTLLELIVVMTLLTAVLAIAAPRLGNFMSGRNVEEETRRFIALTRFARSEAIAHSFRMRLWIAPRRSEYGLRPDAPVDSENYKPLEFQLADKLELEIDPALLDQNGEAVLLFWPDGSIDELSPNKFMFTENGKAQRVIALAQNRLEYMAENAADARR